MRSFLTWLLFPSLCVCLGIWISPYSTALNEYETLDVTDNKVSRTLRTFDAERDVDRPGMHIALYATAEDFVDFRESWRHNAQVQIAFEDGPRRNAMLRIRGASSRLSQRKSFLVSLFEPQGFGGFELRKFLLLNMLYDPGQFEMFTSYRLLRELGLFPGYAQFAELTMNGEPRGLYLVVERPEDAIRRNIPEAVSVLRSALGGGASVKYSKQLPTPLLLVERLRGLTEGDGNEAQAVEGQLEAIMDLDQYLLWLAFNSLFENGDSRNELYMYEKRAPGQTLGRLGFVAWDYDDVQGAPMRPAEILQDPLFYAAEMEVDALVLRTPSLYRRYQQVLATLLEDRLPEARLLEAVSDVRQILDGIQPPGRARESRALMQEFERRLLARRRELLELLRDRDARAWIPG